MKIVLLLVGAVLVVGLVGGAYFLGQKQNTQTVAPAAPPSPPAPVAPATPSPTVSPIPTDPNIKTFTSTELGVSFNYLSVQGKDEFTAKAIGNKVYVYWANRPIQQGQYVEVFSKDRSDDLKTAIEKKILSSYSKQDCFVVVGEKPSTDQPIPTNFVVAKINFPRPASGAMEAFAAAAQKCPQPYTAFGGIGYFAMDTTHPDKFVFFSIGQYYIDAGGGVAWQSTLKFL